MTQVSKKPEQSQQQPSDYDVLTFWLKKIMAERKRCFRQYYCRDIQGGYERRSETGYEFEDLYPFHLDEPRDCTQVRLLLYQEEVLAEVRRLWKPGAKVLVLFNEVWEYYFDMVGVCGNRDEDLEYIEHATVCLILKRQFPEQRAEILNSMV